MKLSRGKLSIILFLHGFLFIVLDVNIDTGIAYPNNYNNSDNVIGEFQYYNIKSTYGASCTYKMIDTSMTALCLMIIQMQFQLTRPK